MSDRGEVWSAHPCFADLDNAAVLEPGFPGPQLVGAHHHPSPVMRHQRPWTLDVVGRARYVMYRLDVGARVDGLAAAVAQDRDGGINALGPLQVALEGVSAYANVSPLIAAV